MESSLLLVVREVSGGLDVHVGQVHQLTVGDQGDVELSLRDGSSKEGNARRQSVGSIWVVAK